MQGVDLDITRKVHEIFKSKGLTLALAESCTAGLLSHTLTLLPGASDFLDSAVIAYSAHAKVKLLGIRRSFIEKHGAISEDTARAMAEGMRMSAGVDVALAVTGNLGPEPQEDRKVGLVFIAVASEVETTSRGFMFDGEREEIKHFAAEKALHMLYESVSIWK
jgi:PncC family amidohydrolase